MTTKLTAAALPCEVVPPACRRRKGSRVRRGRADTRGRGTMATRARARPLRSSPCARSAAGHALAPLETATTVRTSLPTLLRRSLALARSTLRRAKRAVRWSRRPRLRRTVLAALACAVLAVTNAGYQLARKPTEILGVVAPTEPKAPAETWAEYGPLFEAHATAAVDAPLLAALAQVESAGDPLARTYWRWRWSWNPLEVYAPASSAVGLLQITDGTFEQARRLCIDAHAVVRPGDARDRRACGLLGAYFRIVPSHAIELTSAWLDDSIADALARARRPRAPAEARRRLAAVIHLCGRERGVAFARRGFWVIPGERCGDHELARYLGQVGALREAFVRIRAAGPVAR